MTDNLPRIRDTLLTALDIFREECGHHPELDEARQFVLAMERIWPTLHDVPDGEDIFKGKYPISGLVDNEAKKS